MSRLKDQMPEVDLSCLPKGWEITTLKDVCLKTSNIKWTTSDEKLYHYIDLSSVSREDFSIMETVQVNKYNAPSRAKKIIKTGDIIFGTTRPTLKRLCIIPEYYDNQICSTGYTVLRPNPNKTISKYLFYSLLQNSFMTRMESLQRGASYPAVTDTDVKGYQIPLPPLPEQQRIVSILDRSFAAIDRAKANAEKNLQNARELFESYLQGVFDPSTSSVQEDSDGWTDRRLGEVCEIIMGQSPKGESYNSGGQGVPLINGPVEFGPEPFSKTIKSKFTTQPTKYCKEDDLILCVRGSTTGRINIAGFDACIGRGVAALRYKGNQEWVNFFILSARKKIYNLGTGSTFPNVSSKILNELKIPIPDIVEQQTIVKKLEALLAETQKLETLYQKKIDDLEELKKSVLQKALRGELETEKELAV